MLCRFSCSSGGGTTIVRRQCIRQVSSHIYSPLEVPTVLYSNNHLLVVNKPVGWHSVPNPKPSPKWLLSELKRMQLGGGSGKDFLLPLHRIDKPCSGVMLLGKTSKVTSRIITFWKKKMVVKGYRCVVSASRFSWLKKNHHPQMVAGLLYKGRCSLRFPS
jgi:23S rRNA-/tRNA-specific pseudouridylate synthase